jgi:hypothetical protein
MNRLRQIFEVIANVAILFVCIMLVWLVISHRDTFFHRSTVPLDAGMALVGKTVQPLPRYQWNQHPETLIIAIRSGCRFCEASFPFYRHLADLQRSSPNVHIVAVMPDANEPGSQMLDRQKLRVDSVFDQPLNSLHVDGTPTILLLNSVGKIERAWVGQLSPLHENEVVASLSDQH